jgi:hypothetical protein
MFKYFSCLMIKSRTLIEIDSNWALSAFLEWRDRVKIIDHSWFSCSQRNWIFLICSTFFFVVKRRSYSFDWTFTFRFSFDVVSRFDDVFYYLRILRFRRRCRFWNLFSFRQRRRLRLDVVLTSSHWWSHQWFHHVYLNFIITAIDFI